MTISLANLREMLRTVPEDAWWQRIVDGSDVERNYVRVMQYATRSDAPSHAAGLLDSGHWVWEYTDLRRVSQPENLWSFLPLLDLERPAVVALLETGVERIGVPAAAIRTFPFDGMMVLALSGSEHWQGLAERWLDAGYPPNDRIAELRPRHPMVHRWKESRLDAILGHH